MKRNLDRISEIQKLYETDIAFKKKSTVIKPRYIEEPPNLSVRVKEIKLSPDNTISNVTSARSGLGVPISSRIEKLKNLSKPSKERNCESTLPSRNIKHRLRKSGSYLKTEEGGEKHDIDFFKKKQQLISKLFDDEQSQSVEVDPTPRIKSMASTKQKQIFIEHGLMKKSCPTFTFFKAFADSSPNSTMVQSKPHSQSLSRRNNNNIPTPLFSRRNIITSEWNQKKHLKMPVSQQDVKRKPIEQKYKEKVNIFLKSPEIAKSFDLNDITSINRPKEMSILEFM